MAPRSKTATLVPRNTIVQQRGTVEIAGTEQMTLSESRREKVYQEIHGSCERMLSGAFHQKQSQQTR